MLDISLYIPRMKEYFSKQEELEIIYLFGSAAAGSMGPLSDVDIAILLKSEIPEERYTDLRLKIMGEIMSMLKFGEVEVVPLNSAPLLFQFRAIRDGKIIFSGSERSRIEYESKVLREYLDYKYFEEAYFEELTKDIKGGILSAR